MNHITFQLLAILLTILVLILARRRLFGLDDRDEDLPRLLNELLRHMPVYSAETTHGREAEFIRDRLPKRFPTMIILLAVVLFGAVMWWLVR